MGKKWKKILKIWKLKNSCYSKFTTHTRKKRNENSFKTFEKNHKLPHNLKSINNSSNTAIIVQPNPKIENITISPYNIKHNNRGL